MTTLRWCAVLLLSGLVLACGLVIHHRFRTPSESPPAREPVEVVWTFEAIQRGAILSSPLVAGDRVYLAAAHDTAFHNAGAVYCLEAATGKLVWRFDDGGSMQHTFSSPCLADGRLFIGEGMHANFTCKLYCLDAATGRKLWHFIAEGHIESSPWVAAGRVYFGAGDDGIWCLDAATGEKHWQFRGPYHVDSSPVVVGEHLYAGSGISRVHQTTEAWCLDATTGKVVWRHRTDLPVWGSPRVAGNEVYFGLGNGRLLTGPAPPAKAAGGLLCLAADTGDLRWRFDAGNAVFGRAAVGPAHVYLGSRNGWVHCLERRTGRLSWKEEVGSPVVASPALEGERLYVVASAGQIHCLDAASGARHWMLDLAARSRTEPRLLSSPAVVSVPRRRIYLGAELRNPASSAAILYCLGD